MEREGIDVERSTLADWVGQTGALLTPLADAIGRHVKAANHVHADDTTAPTLSPGKGRTQTGRYWTYVRDGRPWEIPQRQRFGCNTVKTVKASIPRRI